MLPNWSVKSEQHKLFIFLVSTSHFENILLYFSDSEPDQIVERPLNSAEDRIQQIDGGVTDVTDQEKENDDTDEILPLKPKKRGSNR